MHSIPRTSSRLSRLSPTNHQSPLRRIQPYSTNTNNTQPSTTARDKKDALFARRFFLSTAEFLGPVYSTDRAPVNYPARIQQQDAKPPPLQAFPEVAFAGESNVGKSSLMDALMGNAGLVKTSRRAGHTKTLNYFLVKERLALVDMPGYGLGSHSEWAPVILEYLQTRRALRRVFVLLDCRRRIKPRDREVMRLLEEAGVSYQLVLTKADLFPQELHAFREQAVRQCQEFIRTETRCCWPEVLLTSGRQMSGTSGVPEGVSELRIAILKATGFLAEHSSLSQKPSRRP